MSRSLVLLMIITKLAPSPAYAQRAPIVRETRIAINSNDLARAEALVAKARAESGDSPGNLEALSWLGRGHLAAKHYDQADKFAAETRNRALGLLKTRKLDDDDALPLALGASIEVQAQVLAQHGQRIEAVAFLNKELKTWYSTSIRTRIQKNINLISLEGKPAPVPLLETRQFVGTKPPALAGLAGKPVILFFWAHWCGDCKVQGPVLARLAKEFGPRGLVVVGPTQRYGYVAEGEEAPPAKETPYIHDIFTKYYGAIPGITAPVSEENFKRWGASTTPTLVLIDRKGIVRAYHPGRLTYDELLPLIQKAL